MNISFSSKKLQKFCNSKKESTKKWGLSRSKRIRQRLSELHAAETLADMSHLPPARCHELDGPRKGQLAVDVSKNCRLIFKPDCVPVPKKIEGGIDWGKILDIKVLEIEDYHGE